MSIVYSFDKICPYVREVGLQKRDTWRTLPRKIYDHEMLYCFMGSANIIIEGVHYKIHKGDLVIIVPNVSHYFWLDDDEEGELYWCHFDFFYYEDREWHYEFYNNPDTYLTLFQGELKYKEHIRTNPMFENGFRFPRMLSVRNPDVVEYLFRMLHQNYLRNEKLGKLRAKSYFTELLYTILLDCNHDEEQNVNKEYVVALIKSYVEMNYYKKIFVQDICSVTNLNHEYASKIFKKVTGMNIVEYVNRVRLDKAKILLLDMDLSISEISEMVGFSTENYFSTVTKKLYGKSPYKLRIELLNLISETTSTE